jgi:hypothetical protein
MEVILIAPTKKFLYLMEFVCSTTDVSYPHILEHHTVNMCGRVEVKLHTF